MIELFEHQKKAVAQLRNGSILNGDVGTGKSLTALAYYISKICGGNVEGKIELPEHWVKMVIITTAKKRDSGDWIAEAVRIGVPTDYFVVDSWNNIKKYADFKGCFFIFDEQRAIGTGSWAKTFIKIARKNHFILLSATPGDNWMDYIPIFIANGFYRNRTEFLRRHVVFSTYTTFPKIDRYLDTWLLFELRDKITVRMTFQKDAIPHHIDVYCEYDMEKYRRVTKDKWDIWKDEPIQQAGVEYYLARRVSNESADRVEECLKLVRKHKKAIIFYSFNYELDLLREMCSVAGLVWGELNGKRHDEVPSGVDSWVYLVQYYSGNEAWECIDTDTMIFFSQDTSYKRSEQSSGRINRLNTPFHDLYFYHLKSNSWVDLRISKNLAMKKDFTLKDYERESELIGPDGVEKDEFWTNFGDLG